MKWILSSWVLLFLMMAVSESSAGFVVGHRETDLGEIPPYWLDKTKQDLHIAYNHTSHGSQIITGMNALSAYPAFGSEYRWSDTTQAPAGSLSLDDGGIPGEADLSQGDIDSDGDGIADWAEDTYDYLIDPDNYHVNVIIWSWCNISGHDIPRYIRSMEWLVAQFSTGGSDFIDSEMDAPAAAHQRTADYPVQFVFMTAHANGGGELDSSDSPNRAIRLHCTTYNRILFDFSDIENYDPDENYYLDKLLNDALYYDSDGNSSRDANWASEYLERHATEELYLLTRGTDGYGGCSSCAHSEGENGDSRLNCVLKGRAAWFLFARLAGWDGEVASYELSVESSGDGLVTSDPTGISCGSDCQKRYPENSAVILSAQEDDGWNFLGWSGDCAGSNDCELVMDEDKTVQAHFFLKGDFDGNDELTLVDVILGLSLLAGADTVVSKDGDADADRRIGIADVLYLLDEMSAP